MRTICTVPPAIKGSLGPVVLYRKYGLQDQDCLTLERYVAPPRRSLVAPRLMAHTSLSSSRPGSPQPFAHISDLGSNTSDSPLRRPQTPLQVSNNPPLPPTFPGLTLRIPSISTQFGRLAIPSPNVSPVSPTSRQLSPTTPTTRSRSWPGEFFFHEIAAGFDQIDRQPRVQAIGPLFTSIFGVRFASTTLSDNRKFFLAATLEERQFFIDLGSVRDALWPVFKLHVRHRVLKRGRDEEPPTFQPRPRLDSYSLSTLGNPAETELPTSLSDSSLGNSSFV